MAERRMFSKKIIDAAKFLKMPSSTRLLYFDLGIRADDDGVVEAFNVLRMTGASEDDLRVLAMKGYIKILNDDLVTYIIDWTEHNKLRADRKIDSMYKDLLLQIIPEVPLLEAKERSDRKKKDGTSKGQPKVGIGQVRSGQSRLGQVKSGKDSSSSSNEGDDEDLNIVIELSEKFGLHLELTDIEDFIKAYSLDEVKKAILSTKAATKEITNPIKYITAILNNNTKTNTTIINKNNNSTSSFKNYEQRDFDNEEAEQLVGWDE